MGRSFAVLAVLAAFAALVLVREPRREEPSVRGRTASPGTGAVRPEPSPTPPRAAPSAPAPSLRRAAAVEAASFDAPALADVLVEARASLPPLEPPVETAVTPVPAEDVVRAARARAREDPPVGERCRALEVLAVAGGDEAEAACLEVLAEHGAPPELVRAALAALPPLQDDARPRALPLLVEAARARDAVTRALAARRLAEVPGRTALVALAGLEDDEVEAVRAEARHARAALDAR